MKDRQVNIMHPTPVIIWIVRLCFLAVVCSVGIFWSKSGTVTNTGRFVFGTFVLLSLAAIIASYIRLRIALVVVAICVIAVHLAGFLLMNILVLKGTWWEWCIVFPAQMTIPSAVAYYILKARTIKHFYHKGDVFKGDSS